MESSSIVLFIVALVAYLAGTLLYEGFLIRRRARLAVWARWAVLGAVVAHAGAIGARWVASGHPPMANLFESLSLFAWLIVAGYLLVERFFGIKALGAFVTPVALVAICFASVLPKDITPLVPALQSHWLPVHAAVSFTAYALFTLAFGAAVIYLLQEKQLKQRRPGSWYYRLPPLYTTEHASQTLVAFGFFFLTLSLITGAVWAEQAWGSYWSWDPKETWALITWLIYAAYMHARRIGTWDTRRAAWLLVVGFVSVLITYFGAGLVWGGNHTYIF